MCNCKKLRAHLIGASLISWLTSFRPTYTPFEGRGELARVLFLSRVSFDYAMRGSTLIVSVTFRLTP